MGMREVNERLGWSPLEMLTREELEQIRGLPLPDTHGQVMPALVSEWASTKAGGVSQDIKSQMAQLIVNEPQLVPDDLPTLQTLNTLYAEVKRRNAVRSKRSLDSKMHETLTAKAREIHSRPGR